MVILMSVIAGFVTGALGVYILADQYSHMEQEEGKHPTYTLLTFEKPVSIIETDIFILENEYSVRWYIKKLKETKKSIDCNYTTDLAISNRYNHPLEMIYKLTDSLK